MAATEYHELTERFLNDANEITGDIVLRAAKRKESQNQLRDTVRRITDALSSDPERLDRDLWLSRFSDLMLHGIQFPANSPIDLGAWRMAVRDGQCGIHLRGYSQIFKAVPRTMPRMKNGCGRWKAAAKARSSNFNCNPSWSSGH